MNNYLLIKRLIFALLLIAVIYFLFLITNSFIDKPVIKDINITNLDEINISQSINQPNKILSLQVIIMKLNLNIN